MPLFADGAAGQIRLLNEWMRMAAKGRALALWRALAAAGLIAAMCWPENGFAQAAANFYQGKQITMLVASGAGGGYDTYARTLARAPGIKKPAGKAPPRVSFGGSSRSFSL